MFKHRNRLLILLMFLLLAVQQSALAHSVTHWAEPTQHDTQQLPHEQTCDQCLALAHFGSAMTSNFVMPPTPNATYSVLTVQVMPEVFLQTTSPFYSRAPPAA